MRMRMRWSDNYHLFEGLVFSVRQGDDAVCAVQEIAPRTLCASHCVRAFLRRRTLVSIPVGFESWS